MNTVRSESWKELEDRTTKTVEMPIRFRFPVEWVDEYNVKVTVKLVENGIQLLSLNPDAVKAWGLTEKEAIAAHEAAQNAVIKSVMIVNQ